MPPQRPNPHRYHQNADRRLQTRKMSPTRQHAQQVYHAGVRASRLPPTVADTSQPRPFSVPQPGSGYGHPHSIAMTSRQTGGISVNAASTTRPTGPRWNAGESSEDHPRTPSRRLPSEEDELYDQLQSSADSIKTSGSMRPQSPITPIRPRSVLKRRPTNYDAPRSTSSRRRSVHFARLSPSSSPSSVQNASQASTAPSSPATILATPPTNSVSKRLFNDSLGPWSRIPSDSPPPDILSQDLFSPEPPRGAKRQKLCSCGGGGATRGSQDHPIDLSVDTEDEKESDDEGLDGADDWEAVSDAAETAIHTTPDPPTAPAASAPMALPEDASMENIGDLPASETSADSQALFLPRAPRLCVAISREGGEVAAFKRILEAHATIPNLRGVSFFPYSPKEAVEKHTLAMDNEQVRVAGECKRMIKILPRSFRKRFLGHAVHTTNFGHQDPVELARHLVSLKVQMTAAKRFGIKVLVIHLGNTGLTDPIDHQAAMQRLAVKFRAVLEAVPKVTIAIETMIPGSVGETSGSLHSITEFIDMVDLPGRVKICIDLCHVYAGSHDISTADGRSKFFSDIAELGPHHIGAVHVSDSLEQHGSGSDSHCNLDFGYLSLHAIREVLRHQYFHRIPVILETPGYFAKNRDRGVGTPARIGLLEGEREKLELALLRTACTKPEDEWLEEQVTIRSQWRKEKTAVEAKIGRTVRGGGSALQEEFKEYRRPLISKLQAVGRAKKRMERAAGGPVGFNAPRKQKKARRSNNPVRPVVDGSQRTRAATHRQRRMEARKTQERDEIPPPSPRTLERQAEHDFLFGFLASQSPSLSPPPSTAPSPPGISRSDRTHRSWKTSHTQNASSNCSSASLDSPRLTPVHGRDSHPASLADDFFNRDPTAGPSRRRR